MTRHAQQKRSLAAPRKKNISLHPLAAAPPPQVYNVLLFIDEKLFDYPNQHSYNYDQ